MFSSLKVEMRRTRVHAVGVALALVATAGHANAPAGHYMTSTLNQVSTIVDTRTHLTWQQAAAPGTAAWSGAVAACSALGAGWRLPSVEELESLVDETILNPASDSSFTGTVGCYWTLSPIASCPGTGCRWCVSFVDGRQSLDSTDTDMNFYRCVHD
jgi:hypothetical protein